MKAMGRLGAAAGPWLGAAVLLLGLAVVLAPRMARAEDAAVPPAVRVVTDAAGSKLSVDGRDFMVKGMNWDYSPIGQNYMWSLWSQPDAVIEAALAREMPLLQDMGVNVVRQYVGIPPRWVRYIYETYGIYTIVNHPCGRYGFTFDGVWTPTVDYSNPKQRAAITAEVTALVDQFRGVPGMLMWLLGNENNYGLSWKSAEVEALPQGERDAARARYLYSLFGDIIKSVKEHDGTRPVAIANGDLQYIGLIAEECKGLDVLGTNVYRGISAGGLYQEVKDKLGIPIMYTEFGCDAFNAKTMREDQAMQARYLLGQWEEIYEQSAGKGRVGNAIGGCIFQWSDGWWKFGQESRLDIHDTNASWPNGGYSEDFTPGENNMNEEWWGICAKGPADDKGLFELYPRAAFYALRRAFRLDPYAPGTDVAAIKAHFGAVQPMAAALEGRGDHASLVSSEFEKVRLAGVRLQFETVSTGGARSTTPKASDPSAGFPAFKGFDHFETFYADFEAHPAPNVSGTLSLNVLGHVPTNPIDEIFYENRGRTKTVTTDTGALELQGIERVKVYKAGISWQERDFTLDGFYRTGHYHWGYEGDFFGLYREANYGINIDTYNGEAPVGFELGMKRKLDGLKLAFGPQIWWGANPTLLLKYGRRIHGLQTTALYQEDLTSQSGGATSSVAVPLPPTRKATLQVQSTLGPFGLELGGIWSGSNKVDQPFQTVEKTGATYRILQDKIVGTDALGGKVKLTLQRGRWNWYGQAAHMGLVADAGPTAVTTYTGWSLKDGGTGNQENVVTGVAVNMGRFQVGPNFLWQKPIIGPIPYDVPSPGRPRNVLDDPFAVRSNRETVGAELLIGYDPTPATWMWAWDNDIREDAALAASLGLIYRHLPTTQDASIGILGDGHTTFAFPGAPPPRDLWEMRGRLVSWVGPDLRLVAHAFAGTGEPNGNDARLVHRYGVDGRLGWHSMAFEMFAKVNDWGPYDYHRDFNLTFPLQLMGDVSHTLGSPRWFGYTQTRFGIRGTYRTLDKYSPRYSPTGTPVADLTATGANGREWEVRTYLTLAM